MLRTLVSGKAFLNKGILTILPVTVLYSCRPSPVELAREYCNCRYEIEQGKKSEKDCQELAESHSLRLQDSEGAFEKYAESVSECVTMHEMQKPKK